MDHRKHLRQQVERIIDESTEPLHDLIVQMRPMDEETQRLLATSCEALRRRSMASSARDLLPPDAESLKAEKPTTANRRQLRKARMSAASQVTLLGMEEVTVAALRAAGERALAPLLRSDVVQCGMEPPRKRPKRQGKKDGGRGFWSSRSARLKLDTETLAKLPDQVPDIDQIYVNRELRVPPIVEVQRLPQKVADNKTSAWGIDAIGAMSVWGAYGSRGRGIKVAVLDTGVDADHPDLKGKVKDWREFDEEGEPVAGSKPHDSGQHGTHVAGTIVGGNTSGQWIGVAPEAELAVGMVLNERGGTIAQVLAGIEWALEIGADVINMSLGGLQFEPEIIDTYTRAILNAHRLGVPVIVAIGNEGSQTTGSPGNDFFSLGVGATDVEDRPGGFSGGRTHVVQRSRYIDERYLPLVYSKPDVSAPGVAVRSSIPNNDYAAWNGTSMATPHVSGAVALLLAATDIRSKVPAGRRAYVVQDLLTGSVEELGEAGQDHRFGFGRINALAAIGFAKGGGY